MSDLPVITRQEDIKRRRLENLVKANERRRELIQSRQDADAEDKSYIAPWGMAFAEWYALQLKRPAETLQAKVASELAGAPITIKQIANLRRTENWRTVMNRFREGGIAAARAKMEIRAPWFIDMHEKGLKLADAEGDYRAFPNFTLPYIERVSPRRTDLAQQNLQVNISLSPKQLALEDAEPITITAEPIAPDPIQER